MMDKFSRAFDFNFSTQNPSGRKFKIKIADALSEPDPLQSYK